MMHEILQLCDSKMHALKLPQSQQVPVQQSESSEHGSPPAPAVSHEPQTHEFKHS